MNDQNTAQNTFRYSDKALENFKQLILSKIAAARQDMESLLASVSNSENGGSDDGGAYQSLEDGSATLEKETMYQMAARQKQFINQLEAALGRIENKTYGICRVTGNLIPKERLMAVPHTTLSMEAKQKQ
ncbi:TraR/DksA family transcriptional regulator [Mucilaginibacter yixingensis]|uniref:TraR/DksA family transcriptional regulator n=1 Tax=Mucilaginibacter yixingensis TaxID=1295612 RepID=A0A2T5JFC2_9SPHI|nr:TraR/DksA C4-type zinc finger protein [Mucilaginibacter yixingensis]PTR01132.1 TraR/DksA family transcriptional regulator [Mucilaginibacter yixingensis]